MFNPVGLIHEKTKLITWLEYSNEETQDVPLTLQGHEEEELRQSRV